MKRKKLKVDDCFTLPFEFPKYSDVVLYNNFGIVNGIVKHKKISKKSKNENKI